MKLAKKISAAVLAVAMAASMVFSASAETTVDDVIMAARNNGVQEHNVKQLENFIFENADKFTDAQRADMVAAIEDAATIVKKYTEKDLSTLTEEERGKILHDMSEEDKQAILDKMVEAGKKVEVDITYKKSDTNFGYDVFATYKGKTTPIDDPTPNTGDIATNNSNAAIAIASIAMLLAGTGIVVVAKKNKEN